MSRQQNHNRAVLIEYLVGSLSYGILSLIFYFIAGLIVLPFVKIQKGIQDVKKYDTMKANENK